MQRYMVFFVVAIPKIWDFAHTEKVIPDGGMQDFSKKDYQNNLYLSNIAYYINLFG